MKDLSQRLKKESNERLWSLTASAARRDQLSTLEFLYHLQEVRSRRLFLERGFNSLFQYVVEELKFSESAASERISALRLMFSVPEAKKKIESGELNLTQAAQVQRFLYAEKKKDPGELLKKIQGKSTRGTKKILIAESAPTSRLRERERVVTEDSVELRLLTDPELQALIKRTRELKGDLSLAEIFKEALKEDLKKKDPQLRAPRVKPSGAVQKGATRYIPASVKTVVAKRSGGRCEYVDPTTNRRCSGRFRLQYDHQFPWALGGKNTVQNIRHLCQGHNHLEAERVFGPRFRRESSKSPNPKFLKLYDKPNSWPNEAALAVATKKERRS